MEARSTGKGWTYAEFARLPSEGGTRHEVIGGELVVTPAPDVRHQRIVTDLVTLLNVFVRTEELGHVFAGPVDLLFAEGDYLEPDLVVVLHERAHLLSDRGIEGPPDLVVEVLSPSTASRDRGIKLERYRLYGVSEYWVVDPATRSIDVWSLAIGAAEPDTYLSGDIVRWSPEPGQAVLEITVDELLD